jgi:hypothetical protein
MRHQKTKHRIHEDTVYCSKAPWERSSRSFTNISPNTPRFGSMNDTLEMFFKIPTMEIVWNLVENSMKIEFS